ncbi:MAG: DUF1761 domain-containing protein [Hyphomicrobiales bacterium]|nr:MAG: DUF1761 domain-containing protein [Hyphomicrobiales bacterium]
MILGNVNWLAIIVAMIASMALGAVWYTTLGNRWMAALGKTREQIVGGGSTITPFIWTAAMQLVSAYFLARLTPLVFDTTTIVNAVQLGFFLWLGFVLTSMITNHRYQGSKWSLALIDGGYGLGVLLIQGLVIGLFG